MGFCNWLGETVQIVLTVFSRSIIYTSDWSGKFMNSAGQLSEESGEGSGRRCRSFIKWVGGKSQLLPELLSRLPTSFGRYHEPFLGGGALFFALQPPRANLSDLNSDLVNAYKVVRDQTAGLVDALSRHRYEEEYFYQLRSADRSASFADWTPVDRAARFIYLNKTCYNGLYRVNSKGYFNTPFGRYENPTILDQPNLEACSKALTGASVEVRSFLEVEEAASAGDFVYFDPPYVPLSVTSSFTNYQQNGFDTEMQCELFNLCCRLDRKKVRFMLSNSSAPLVTELYAPFRVELVGASRAINSKAEKRGKVQEVIVRNY